MVKIYIKDIGQNYSMYHIYWVQNLFTKEPERNSNLCRYYLAKVLNDQLISARRLYGLVILLWVLRDYFKGIWYYYHFYRQTSCITFQRWPKTINLYLVWQKQRRISWLARGH